MVFHGFFGCWYHCDRKVRLLLWCVSSFLPEVFHYWHLVIFADVNQLFCSYELIFPMCFPLKTFRYQTVRPEPLQFIMLMFEQRINLLGVVILFSNLYIYR